MVSGVEDGVLHYSFALEYTGPPLSYDIPHAVPINVNRIPVAAVVPHLASLHDKLSLPVVKPLLPASDPGKKLNGASALNNNTSNAIKLSPRSDDVTTVSPTFVIERAVENLHGDSLLSGELSVCSSAPLDFSNSLDNKSRESSSSRLNRVSNDLSHDWETNESVVSVEYPSFSRVSSGKDEESEFSDGKKTLVVTFRDLNMKLDD